MTDLGEDFTIEEIIKICEIEFKIFQKTKKSFNQFLEMASNQ
jgi:hypothetical protein